MKYRYYICDVFTERRFGGNPLAVLPRRRAFLISRCSRSHASSTSPKATSSFPQKRHTRHVRIFTPAAEIPFAGHPNVGTAFVLAAAGEFGEINSSLAVTFEEEAG